MPDTCEPWCLMGQKGHTPHKGECQKHVGLTLIGTSPERLCPGCSSGTTNPRQGFLCGSPVFDDPTPWRDDDRTEACHEIEKLRREILTSQK